MEKQSTIGIVIIFGILFAWMYFFTPAPTVKQPDNSKQTELAKPDTTKNENQPIETKKDEIVAVDSIKAFTPSLKKESIITVETALYKMELTSNGGKIKKIFLKNFKTWYNQDLPENAPFFKKFVQLVNQNNGGDFNIVFVTKDGRKVNTGNLEFTKNLTGHYFTVAENDSLSLRYTYSTPEKNLIHKDFKFYGNRYDSKIDIAFENMSNILGGYSYDLLWETGINLTEHRSDLDAAGATANVYSGEELTLVDVSDVDEPQIKEFNGKIDWVGIKNKYFGIILSEFNPTSNGGVYIKGIKKHTNWGDKKYYEMRLKVPIRQELNQTDSFQFYAGPLEYKILKSYDKNFESIYDFGSFFGMTFISRPISEYILLPTFTFLHEFFPNYGVVIIVFSILLKLVLYPLTQKSYQSMKRMQLLQPKIQELKQKYPDDPQRVQREQMKLYSTYGVNPMGGCLPMLLPMPILFALFTFFSNTVELRHQPFFGWISDLSSPDVAFTLPFSLPLLGADISALALLMGISMFIQQKMTMKDPSQKAMVYMMPVMLTIMFNSLASGLNLYYTLFNVLSIGQQYLVNKSKSDSELVPVANPKKAGGFMARLMDAAEQKQKEQQSFNKGKKK